MRIIIVGQGRLIYNLAKQLARRKNQCTLVVENAEEAQNLSQRIETTILVGSGTDRQVLENAGIRQADAILALTPEDEDNLAICQMARSFKIPRTIALVNDPDNEDVFHKLHVSVAISATRILSTILQEEVGFEQLIEMMSLVEGKVSISEILLKEDTPAANATIEELKLPEGALIGGVIRKAGVIVPWGKTKLEAGDRLLLIATAESHEIAVKICGGEAR
ncbi:MAG: NAD-binding protein [Desulfuromonadales bacterium]|nr:NAD-binding protein [Desulfuromonadales bacterium]MBN2791409.1 NAD-binding protein [Desulfuromonadales bacterium]